MKTGKEFIFLSFEESTSSFLLGKNVYIPALVQVNK